MHAGLSSCTSLETVESKNGIVKETQHSRIIINEDMHKNLSQIIEIYHNLAVINTTNFNASPNQIHQLPNISLTSNLLVKDSILKRGYSRLII